MALQTSYPGSLIPAQPLVPSAQVFTSRIHGLLDGQPKDEATVAEALNGLDDFLDMIAAKLYTQASMLIGEGEESIRLVETAIANAELATCNNPEQGRRSSRLALCVEAIKLLEEREPGSLAAPTDTELPKKCIEGDDLDSSGISGDELEAAISGGKRERVRVWLTSLPAALRTIFVLRAVTGFSPAETAELLRANGGPQAAAWTEDAVRIWFRRALCSLATQVLRAAAA
jgi:DNA-directed RNA polymerase specialized sigma24 family protein